MDSFQVCSKTLIIVDKRLGLLETLWWSTTPLATAPRTPHQDSLDPILSRPLGRHQIFCLGLMWFRTTSYLRYKPLGKSITLFKKAFTTTRTITKVSLPQALNTNHTTARISEAAPIGRHWRAISYRTMAPLITQTCNPNYKWNPHTPSWDLTEQDCHPLIKMSKVDLLALKSCGKRRTQRISNFWIAKI